MTRPGARWAFYIGVLLITHALGACTAATVEPPEVMEGRVVYAEYCALCHGDEGQGYIADNANALANPQFQALSTDAFLREALVRGRPGTPMSAWGELWGGPLSSHQVDVLMALMRTWRTEGQRDAVHDLTVTGEAGRGVGLFDAACAGCHGPDGRGGAEFTAMGVANPVFLDTVSDGYLKTVIAEGRPDTDMPAFGGDLTEQSLNDLVALLRSWAEPVDGTPPETPSKNLGDPRINPDGPAPDFVPVDGLIPADAVKAALDNGAEVVLLDARAASDYVLDHIAGAVSVPFFDVADFLDQLPKDAWIITYCGCPHAASGQAREILRENGYTKVAILDEGYYVWTDRGYPTLTGALPGPWPAP